MCLEENRSNEQCLFDKHLDALDPYRYENAMQLLLQMYDKQLIDEQFILDKIFGAGVVKAPFQKQCLERCSSPKEHCSG